MPLTADATAAANDASYDGYVQFIKAQKHTPVGYIVGLFKTYDIVVLCERAHPETTQYDMIYELVADQRFQEQAGHIFTEYGTRTIRPDVESFLTDDTLTGA